MLLFRLVSSFSLLGVVGSVRDNDDDDDDDLPTMMTMTMTMAPGYPFNCSGNAPCFGKLFYQILPPDPPKPSHALLEKT